MKFIADIKVVVTTREDATLHDVAEHARALGVVFQEQQQCQDVIQSVEVSTIRTRPTWGREGRPIT